MVMANIQFKYSTDDKKTCEKLAETAHELSLKEVDKVGHKDSEVPCPTNHPDQNALAEPSAPQQTVKFVPQVTKRIPDLVQLRLKLMRRDNHLC